MNTALIGKLSSGDLVAINAVYHLQCLMKLHRQAMNIEAAGDNLNHEARFLWAQAFADLVDYVESQLVLSSRCLN